MEREGCKGNVFQWVTMTGGWCWRWYVNVQTSGEEGGRMLEVVRECADLRRWKHQTLQAEGIADGWHCRRIVM